MDWSWFLLNLSVQVWMTATGAEENFQKKEPFFADFVIFCLLFTLVNQYFGSWINILPVSFDYIMTPRHLES